MEEESTRRGTTEKRGVGHRWPGLMRTAWNKLVACSELVQGSSNRGEPSPTPAIISSKVITGYILSVVGAMLQGLSVSLQ